jgi:beta-N-acetylhexosaminidase
MRSHRSLIADFGQLFLMAFDGPALPDDVAEFLRTFHIGGVVLFADNYRDPAQLRALVDDLQQRAAAPGRPLFIATDHEGGRVQRFRAGFAPLPPLAELGRGEVSETERFHERAARELASCGINVNFAPVADLCPCDAAGAIGDRSFGDDPDRTASHVAAAARAIARAGLLACAKHFPGHGSTTEDSHRVLPSVGLGLAELASRDLIPFRAAIEAGVGAVMTAHVVYSGDSLPASLSPFWLRDVLRGALGFDGVIITDAIEMKALKGRFRYADAGALALEAGSDVILYYKEGHQYEAFWELRSRLERHELDAARVAESLERVEAAKARLVTAS